MGFGLSMGPRLELRQAVSQELRLAQRLQQQLQLKMNLEQVLELVQRLWPGLTSALGKQVEVQLGRMLRAHPDLQESLPAYLIRSPSAQDLQSNFPILSPLFNTYYKTRGDYGSLLRQGQMLTLSLSQSLQQTLGFPPTNWSLVDAYEAEEDKGCHLPKDTIPGLDKLPLEARLQIIDSANEVFHYSYAHRGRKFFRVPLLRNRNINAEQIAQPIGRAEYESATTLLEKAGRIQRIVRAVPYAEIHRTIVDHVENLDRDLEEVVLIGIDRGGRLPLEIVRRATGKPLAYFLKVNQGADGDLDIDRLQKHIDDGTFRGKYLVFVDSTVDSGRQISVLRKYFDDEDLQMEIGHRGWVVVGSNENGRSLPGHINIDWGLDPDQAFEDDPNLLGVDYASTYVYTRVRATPTKMSSFLRSALAEVPKGVVLQAPIFEGKKASSKRDKPPNVPKVLIIGDGKVVTFPAEDAQYIAHELNGRYHVLAGTPNGNPGCLIDALSGFGDTANVTLLQPAYADIHSSHRVEYVGKTKGKFRASMIRRASAVLAVGGNDGTWDEIQRSVHAGKPTFVLRDASYAATQASSIGNTSCLYIGDTRVTMKALHERLAR